MTDLQVVKNQSSRKYPRRKLEIEMRLGHEQDDHVMAILASKKPAKKAAQFVRDAIEMIDAAEKGDFSLLIMKYGGVMLMAGMLPSIAPMTRSVPESPLMIEPPVNSIEDSTNIFNLLL